MLAALAAAMVPPLRWLAPAVCCAIATSACSVVYSLDANVGPETAVDGAPAMEPPEADAFAADARAEAVSNADAGPETFVADTGDAREGATDSADTRGEGAADAADAGADHAAADAQCVDNPGTGNNCGNEQVISGGDPDTLYHCNGPGPATVVQVCPAGCIDEPPGVDDFCNAVPRDAGAQ